MGKVGKAVWDAVCNALYANIKGGRQDEDEEPIKPLSPDSDSFLDPDTIENSVEQVTEINMDDAVQKPKDAARQEAKEKEEEKEDARDITNQQANTARKAAYQAAINAGVTPAQAQAAADAQTPVGNYAGNYAALAGAGANARAAYRERQGYADALERETKNLEEARNREIAAAALSGGSAGFQTGYSLFGN